VTGTPPPDRLQWLSRDPAIASVRLGMLVGYPIVVAICLILAIVGIFV
jgi:hypothetical protein